MQNPEENKDLHSSEDRIVYDEETVVILKKRAQDAFTGKMKTYTVEESLEDIRKHRLRDL